MKILYLTYNYWPPSFGGELLNCIERLKSLISRGHQAIVLTSGKAYYARHEMLDGIEVFRSPLVTGSSATIRSFNQLIYYAWVLWKLTRVEYDVVHIGYLVAVSRGAKYLVINALAKSMNWLIVRLLRKRGVRTYYVYSLADSPGEPVVLAGFSAGLKKRFLQAVSCVIAVSPAIHKSLQRKIPSSNAVLLPYGVQDGLFMPLSKSDRDAVREQLRIGPGVTIFSFLGSVVPRKGFDLLAEAFVELSGDHPDWKLLVIGPRSAEESSDVLESDIRQASAPLGGNAQVMFLGRINDRREIARCLAASDVFVFPSRNEGMGIAPMEAMSTGIPVIVSRLPGITDQANIDGETGIYIPVDCVDALKHAMLRLGTEDSLRERMGRRAREVIVARFGWARYIDSWERLYMQGKESSTRVGECQAHF